MEPEIGTTVDKPARNSKVGVRIITGVGRSFCAGGDFRYS